MVGKEDRPSSSSLDMTPTLSGSCYTRVSLDQPPSVTPLKPCLQQSFENSPNKVLVPPNSTIIARHLCSSTIAHTCETRELWDLEDDEMDVEINEQTTREVEVTLKGAGATKVPFTHLHPVQLTPVQGQTTRGLVTGPPRTSPSLAASSRPSSTASWPSPMASQTSAMASRPLSTVPQASSMVSWPSSTASRAPYIPNATPNLHLGPTAPFLPSSVHTISCPLTHLPSKQQCSQHFFHPLHFIALQPFKNDHRKPSHEASSLHLSTCLPFSLSNDDHSNFIQLILLLTLLSHHPRQTALLLLPTPCCRYNTCHWSMDKASTYNQHRQKPIPQVSKKAVHCL